MRKRLDDEDEIIADGQSVRVPVYLMDSRQRWVHAKYSAFDARAHQPHYAELSDELMRRRTLARELTSSEHARPGKRRAAL